MPFTGISFIPPPADQKFNPYVSDPAVEGPCQACHTRIDPAAIHNIEEGGDSTISRVPGAARLPQMQRRQGLSDTALAVLALAGRGGLSEDQLFHAAYGFAFSHNVHGGVLDVLLPRARAHLGDAGGITRSRGVLALAIERPPSHVAGTRERRTLPDDGCAHLDYAGHPRLD